ncbi:MAG: hypothetical protein WDN04_18540 [Rhodospirillales bacterium]
MKDAKSQNTGFEREVSAQAREPGQRQRDRNVGEADRAIADGLRPNQPRLPKQAETVWRQVRRGKKPFGKASEHAVS